MSQYDSQTFSTLIDLDMLALATAKGETKEKYLKILNSHVNKAVKAFPDSSLPITLMQNMVTFHRNNSASIEYLEPLVFKLYDTAYANRDPLVKRQAENLLIAFFSSDAPQTLQGKQHFLKALSQKQNIVSSGKIVSPVLNNVVRHYIEKNQYEQDPNLSIVRETIGILNTFSNEEKRRVLTNSIRKVLIGTAIDLHTFAPEITAPYFKEWTTKFSSFVPRQYRPSDRFARELAESPDAVHLVRKSRTQQKD